MAPDCPEGGCTCLEDRIEIRRDDKGGIDEIFGHGVIAHMERMDKGSWFLILTRPDQTQEAFWLNGKGKVEFTLHEHRTAPETGPNAAPWSTAGLPTEEEIGLALVEAREQRKLPADIWAEEVAHIREMEAKYPEYITSFSLGCDALRQARAMLALFAIEARAKEMGLAKE